MTTNRVLVSLLACGALAAPAHRAWADDATKPLIPAQPVVAPLDATPAQETPPAPPQPGNPAPLPTPQQPQPNAPPAGDQPEIYAAEPVVDFGEVLQGELKKHSFVVGNRGKADLVIHNINPTCGCTIAHVKGPDGTDYDPKQRKEGVPLLSLKPEQTCEVMVEFNSTGQPTHKLEKTVVVISSDNKQPALQLTMKVDIIRAVTLEPNPVQFGEVIKGSTATQRAYAKLEKVTDLEITGWQDKPDYLDVKWEKGTAPDGTNAVVFDITLNDRAPMGYLTSALIATTSNPKMPTLQLPVYAQVKSEIVFDTGNKINKERVDFEVIDFGEERTREIAIRNGNAQVPYNITNVTIDSAYKDKISAEVQTIEPGRQHKIVLKTAKDLDARFFRGTVKIESDCPEMKEKLIDFHGWVKKKGP